MHVLLSCGAVCSQSCGYLSKDGLEVDVGAARDVDVRAAGRDAVGMGRSTLGATPDQRAERSTPGGYRSGECLLGQLPWPERKLGPIDSCRAQRLNQSRRRSTLGATRS